jgi:hypothetical protein
VLWSWCTCFFFVRKPLSPFASRLLGCLLYAGLFLYSQASVDVRALVSPMHSSFTNRFSSSWRASPGSGWLIQGAVCAITDSSSWRHARCPGRRMLPRMRRKRPSVLRVRACARLCLRVSRCAHVLCLRLITSLQPPLPSSTRASCPCACEHTPCEHTPCEPTSCEHTSCEHTCCDHTFVRARTPLAMFYWGRQCRR